MILSKLMEISGFLELVTDVLIASVSVVSHHVLMQPGVLMLHHVSLGRHQLLRKENAVHIVVSLVNSSQILV